MKSGETPWGALRARLRGAAAIEAAIVLAFLITLLMGVFQFGLAIYRYDSLVTSVRAGVRYLSVRTPGQAYSNAKALIICGNPGIAPSSCPDADSITGLTESMIQICDRSNATACAGVAHSGVSFGTPPDDGKVDLVTVKITGFPFTFSIPFTSLGSITFGEISSTMVQGGGA